MSEFDTSISNYPEIKPDTGPILVIPPSTSEESFLPHFAYVSLALCELDIDDSGGYSMAVEAIRHRINEIVSQIHADIDVHDTVFDYFNTGSNLYDLLIDLEDSGYLGLEDNIAFVGRIQMEMLYLGLTDLFKY